MSHEWMSAVAAVAGVLVAIAAAVIAGLALLASNRSARAAEQAAAFAQASVTEARLMRQVAERGDLQARTPGLTLDRSRARRAGLTTPVRVWVVPDRDVDDLVVELVVDPAAPQLNAAQWIADGPSPTGTGSSGPLSLGPTEAQTRARFWVGPNGGWNGRMIRIRCTATIGEETWPPQVLEVQSQPRPPRTSRIVFADP